jgi:CheY-like chemotaxis protein
VALLLTDVRMPGMSGLELAMHVRSLEPRLPVLLMSGAALPDRQGFDLLPKPFTHEDLIRRTEEALGA